MTGWTLLTGLVATAMATPNLMAGLNPPQVLNSQLAKTSGKTPVLVYYANETHLTGEAARKHRIIVKWLQSSPHEAVRKLGETIDDDRTQFADVVRKEVAAIRASASDSKIGIAIFTNRMAARGRFLYRLSGGEFQQASFRVLRGTDVVDGGQALSTPGGLTAALKAVAHRFSPRDHEYLLVMKSHGTADRVLVPRVGIDASALTRERLLSRLTPTRDETAKTDNLGTVASSNLGTSSSSQLGTGKAVLVGRAGTRKSQFTRMLHSLQKRQGLTFRAVFLESCQSWLDRQQRQQLQPSVGTLYTSNEDGLPYQTLRYRSLFRAVSIGDSLFRAFAEQLKE